MTRLTILRSCELTLGRQSQHGVLNLPIQPGLVLSDRYKARLGKPRHFVVYVASAQLFSTWQIASGLRRGTVQVHASGACDELVGLFAPGSHQSQT